MSSQSNDKFSLVLPSTNYHHAFSKLVEDYGTAGELGKYEFYRQGLADFTGYVATLISQATGDGLPPGWVPTSNFWLLSPTGEIAGIARLRHTLNSDLLKEGGHIGYDIVPTFRHRGLGTLLLRLTLEKSDQLKINRLLLTCKAQNLPSRRVIEANNGRLESIDSSSMEGGGTCRYWINRSVGK